MTTYKLFMIKDGHLFPLYVEHKREMPIGIWIDAGIGELVDESHVKAHGLGGRVALRPGFHSTLVPFTDWIGKRGRDGNLLQRKNTVWCECLVRGREQMVSDRRGLKTLPSDWYFFKTNSRQKDPWIISNRLFINRILTHSEVQNICKMHGITAREVEK
ncbi:MAG: hypothetical protein IJ899_04625 [Blautia sp.]|nr:hypothetical protein [Blautia sp.]